MIHEILGDSTRKVSFEDLCLILRLTPREVYEQIALERRQGWPICAGRIKGDSGYFLGDAGDCRRQIHAINSSIRELQQVRKSLKTTAEKMKEEP